MSINLGFISKTWNILALHQLTLLFYFSVGSELRVEERSQLSDHLTDPDISVSVDRVLGH